MQPDLESETGLPLALRRKEGYQSRRPRHPGEVYVANTVSARPYPLSHPGKRNACATGRDKWVGLLFRVSGKVEVEPRVATFLALDGQRAAVFPRDAVTDGQTEPGSHVAGLRREERIEDP